MQKEVWKDIPNYEGFYQVSNFGNVKSLEREIYNKKGKLHYRQKEKIMSLNISYHYQKVQLHKNFQNKKYYVHHLVSIVFLNHTPNGSTKIVIDHIDGDKSNNNVNNLQIISQSMNALKAIKRRCKTTSKYKGVSFDKCRNKWVSSTTRNGKGIFLGRFETEIEAYNKYKQFNNKLCQ
jgi:hypothetical protein